MPAAADAGAGAPSAPKLSDEFHAIENPSVIGTMAAPETLTVGRAEVRPQAPATLWVFAVAGEPAGYVLDGPGTLTYRVEDKFSVAPARTNLKETKGIDVKEAGDGLVLTTPIQGMAVWGRDLELAGPIDSVEGQALPEWLREALEEKYSSNPGRDFLRTSRHGHAGYRWALIRGKSEDLVLDVDPQPSSLNESLSLLDDPRSLGNNPFSRKRFSSRLIVQPIGVPWWQGPMIEFVSTETDIDMREVERDRAQVTTKTRLQVQAEGLQVLSLRLSNGVFDGNDWMPFELSNLTLDGRPVDYHRYGQEIFIPLPRPAKAGESFLVEAKAEGNILVRPSGDNYWRLGGNAWYLKPGIAGEEWAEVRTSAEVLAPYSVFAAGEVLEHEKNDKTSRVKTRLKAPMGFAMVLAGKHQTLSHEHETARVHVSSYAAVKEKEADRVAQVILSSMDCLGAWLGVPYPFQDLQVIEMNQWGWAQAPPGMIFVNQEAFLTQASARLDSEKLIGSYLSRGTNERLAHEVAHAWFPHVAKVVRGEENWLSESLADYSSAICIEQKMSNKRKGKRLFDRQLQQWKKLSERVGDASSVYLAHHIVGADLGRNHRYALLYGRGPLVIHAIRQQLQEKRGEKEGDRLFFTWLRSYIKNFTYKVAETRHLITILD
ncbi:MAG: M1 family aminopeptidase, partial [Acidobacteriota bacterium]